MTWNELKAKIEDMDKEQAETDVTVFARNEFIPMQSISFADPEFNDVLDPNHPFLSYI
jgi:hypothetical protein